MRSRRWIIAALLVAVAAASGRAQADSNRAIPRYRARLLGAYDETSGEPIEGVRVLDLATGASSLTSSTGAVALFYLPDGGSLVRLQKIGYEAQTLAIAISPSDTAPITIIMRRLTELPAVETKATETSRYLSPNLRAFEERQKRGFGTFIGDSVLRANENHLLANVLMGRGPGVMIRQGSGSATYLMKSPHCVSGGPPQVYLDGVPLAPDPIPGVGGRRGGRGASPATTLDNLPFDLTKFDVSTLAGVEWYPDNDVAPIEFSHTSGRCGTLLLWTRER